MWEQCPDEKLLEIIRDANEPEEVLYRTEDWILERQETAEIDNYTMAVTFVRKVYQSPKKAVDLKEDTHGRNSRCAGCRRNQHRAVSWA